MGFAESCALTGLPIEYDEQLVMFAMTNLQRDYKISNGYQLETFLDKFLDPESLFSREPEKAPKLIWLTGEYNDGGGIKRLSEEPATAFDCYLFIRKDIWEFVLSEIGAYKEKYNIEMSYDTDLKPWFFLANFCLLLRLPLSWRFGRNGIFGFRYIEEDELNLRYDFLSKIRQINQKYLDRYP